VLRSKAIEVSGVGVGESGVDGVLEVADRALGIDGDREGVASATEKQASDLHRASGTEKDDWEKPVGERADGLIDGIR
jgi:hypothetical protein